MPKRKRIAGISARTARIMITGGRRALSSMKLKRGQSRLGRLGTKAAGGGVRGLLKARVSSGRALAHFTGRAVGGAIRGARRATGATTRTRRRR